MKLILPSQVSLESQRRFEDLLTDAICSRAWPTSDANTFCCKRCGVRGLRESLSPASAVFTLGVGHSCVLRPQAGDILTTLALLADNQQTDFVGKVHINLDHFLCSRVLQEARHARWSVLGEAGRAVVPFEIEPDLFADFARVTACLSRVASQLVPSRSRPWLVLICELGALRPPPVTDPDHVLAWLGIAEGGALVLLPDGTPVGLDGLQTDVQRRLSASRDC